MESWPLISRPQPCQNYGDVSHILREVFNDYFTDETITNQTLELLKDVKYDTPDYQEGDEEINKVANIL